MKFYVMMVAALLLTMMLIQPSHATLSLTIKTDKDFYNLDNTVLISGNLTENGLPVGDALVAVQINDPAHEIHTVRTLTTGTGPAGPWLVEILSIVPLQSHFPAGGAAAFNVTFRNNGLTSYFALILLSFHYGNNVPFAAVAWWNATLEAGATLGIVMEVGIPNEAPGGPAYVYGNALSGLPQNDGWAYSPEKPATFGITQTENGTFNTAFKIPRVGGMLGEYTVYACTFYNMQLISNERSFMVVLPTDLDGNGIIDITDVATVAFAFGSQPGDPRWNPICDLDPNDFIDITDVSLVAFDFGKSGTLPP